MIPGALSIYFILVCVNDRLDYDGTVLLGNTIHGSGDRWRSLPSGCTTSNIASIESDPSPHSMNSFTIPNTLV